MVFIVRYKFTCTQEIQGNHEIELIIGRNVP